MTKALTLSVDAFAGPIARRYSMQGEQLDGDLGVDRKVGA